MRRTLRTNPSLEYSLYVPTAGANGAPVLVTAHGISQTLNRQAEAFVAGCEALGVTLLAPSFSGALHADYQRLGREGRGQRADAFMHRCLQELNSLTGADTTRVSLFGHSGGAQFVHRYLMAHPHRVTRAVVSGAGWYTFPDPKVTYPYGIRSSRKLPGVVFDPEAYLQLPVTVLIGSNDTLPVNLRTSDRVNVQQGPTRLDRARNWVAAMQAQAEAHGIASHVRLIELAQAGHSFSELCHRSALLECVFHALFDAPMDLPVVAWPVPQGTAALDA